MSQGSLISTLFQRRGDDVGVLAVVAGGRGFAPARDAVCFDLEDYALESVGRTAGDGEGTPGVHLHGLDARLQVRPPLRSRRSHCSVGGHVLLPPAISRFLGGQCQMVIKVVLGTGWPEKENGGTHGSGPVLVQRLGEHAAGPSHPPTTARMRSSRRYVICARVRSAAIPGGSGINWIVDPGGEELAPAGCCVRY